MGGLESLHLHMWRLSRNLSTRLDFQKWLQRLSHHTIKDPQHVPTKESGTESSTGVVKEISPYAKPLFPRYQSPFCTCGGI